MPLVRIALIEGKPADATTGIAMVETINCRRGQIQLITEHSKAPHRRLIVIQITLSEGRSVDLKALSHPTLSGGVSRHGGCFHKPGRGEEGKLVVRERHRAVRRLRRYMRNKNVLKI